MRFWIITHDAGAVRPVDLETQMKISREKSALVLGLGETGLSMARYLERRGARVRVADTPRRPAGPRGARRAKCRRRSWSSAPIATPRLPASISSPSVRACRWRRRRCAPPPRAASPCSAISNCSRRRCASAAAPAQIRAAGAGHHRHQRQDHGDRAHRRHVPARRPGDRSGGQHQPGGARRADALRRRRQQPEVWVLELSSFQLETTRTLNPAAATVLNLSEDHLDRYDGIDAYARGQGAHLQG